ncbi:MAG TPA: ATP-binding protein [Syntrophales bacterium]|nr:ATP-binding protein [Syntrophales bacterium]HQL90575.1 ATP-binding protein [Syntrophales bacterium]
MALNVSILFRLISGYLLIIVVVLLSGLYTIWNLSEFNRLIRAVTSYDTRMIQLSEECQEILYSANASEKKYFVSGDETYRGQFKDIERTLAGKLAELASLAETERKRTLLEGIRTAQVRYGALFDDMAALAGSRRVAADEMARYRIEQDLTVAETVQSLRDLTRISYDERDDKLREIEAKSVRTADAILISLVVAMVLMIAVSVLNTQSINVPISRLRDKTKAVARGDFGEPLDIASPPEIRELAEAFNAMCDRLRELDQMKIDYISHLSHELRTPLTAIREASCMLEEGLFRERPEKQRELHTLIREDCERLIRSVTRLLDFSMMESGTMPLTMQTAPLGPLVERNLQRFSPVAQRKHIEMHVEIPPDLPPIRMDTEKIEVVIENLLSNALKFTPDGGRITIAACRRPDAGLVEVAVSDTGRGIPESGLKEVFEKFKRVDDGKSAVRGTGLGLAIVKHIIKAHGGRVWAESEIGKGSTFTFSLPA